jgi:hypothetical protein
MVIHWNRIYIKENEMDLSEITLPTRRISLLLIQSSVDEEIKVSLKELRHVKLRVDIFERTQL